MKIQIPKGFFEDKSSVTPAELLKMTTDMVDQIQELEEKLNYELETDFKYMNENVELKKEIKVLKEEIRQLRRGISA